MSVASPWPHTLDIEYLTQAIQELVGFEREDAMAIAARLHGYPVSKSTTLGFHRFRRGEALLMKFRSRYVDVKIPARFEPKITLSMLLDY